MAAHFSRLSMSRLIALCLCAALFSQGTAHADPLIPITYTILDQPTLQAGYHLSGQIVTDGKIGTLSSGDINSWNYQITNPSGMVVGSHKSTDQGAFTSVSGTVTATATTIYVPPSPTGTDLSNAISLELINGFLSWGQTGTISGKPAFSQISEFEFTPPATLIGFTGPAITPQLDQLLVATVPSVTPTPEPISLVLAIIGGGMLAGAGIARRRVKE
jgi:hypothetical protein